MAQARARSTTAKLCAREQVTLGLRVLTCKLGVTMVPISWECLDERTR